MPRLFFDNIHYSTPRGDFEQLFWVMGENIDNKNQDILWYSMFECHDQYLEFWENNYFKNVFQWEDVYLFGWKFYEYIYD